MIGYLLAISFMLAGAVGMKHPGRGRIAAAAILFYISDVAVARWRFVSPGPENAFFCYPLYYAACILFATALPADPGKSP